jgi:hypothetical protein
MEHFIRNTYLHKFRALKPLLDLVAVVDPPDIVAWFGTREVLRDLRNLLTGQYAWAIPDSRALECIARYSPIVEIGAGTGYWASLLRLLGADVIAYDQSPPPSPDHASWDERSTFTEVLQGTEDCVAQHPERTLFLCWPPAGDEMASRALGMTKAQHFIYVGWHDDDVTGDDAFHQLLKEQWQLVDEVTIPQWPEMKDKLFVYRRR